MAIVYYNAKITAGNRTLADFNDAIQAVRVDKQWYISMTQSIGDGSNTSFQQNNLAPTENQSTYPITKTHLFSEDRAWVEFSDDGKTKLGLIDNKGKLLYSRSSDYVYCYPFTDGLSLVVISGPPDYYSIIVDSSGKVTFDSIEDGNGYIVSGYGNGHFLAMQHITNFDTNEWRFGTIDKNGKVLNNFKTDYAAATAISEVTFRKTVTGFVFKEWRYLGDGYLFTNYSFAYFNSSFIYSIGQNKFYDSSKSIYEFLGKYQNGWTLYAEADGSILADPSNYADEKSRFVDIKIPPYEKMDKSVEALFGDSETKYSRCDLYSEGLVFARQGRQDYGYYNIQGEKVISFPDWTNRTYGGAPFSGGFAAIRLIGADGKEYATVIDKNGKAQYEPIAVESFNVFDSYNGYVLVKLSGEDVLIDPKGNVKRPGVDDISGIGDARIINISGGFISRSSEYISVDGKTVINSIHK